MQLSQTNFTQFLQQSTKIFSHFFFKTIPFIFNFFAPFRRRFFPVFSPFPTRNASKFPEKIGDFLGFTFGEGPIHGCEHGFFQRVPHDGSVLQLHQGMAAGDGSMSFHWNFRHWKHLFAFPGNGKTIGKFGICPPKWFCGR